MTRFLVTGGAGFIGSHLVAALVELGGGSQVRVLDNFATGSHENIAPLNDRIELIEGDLREFDAVSRAVQGIDIIYHQAALPSVARSVERPLDSNSANITGTLHLLTAARDARVRRVILASSSSVYGDAGRGTSQPPDAHGDDRSSPVLPKEESMTPAPLSPYAVTKLTGELYARVFAQLYCLETICLRYFNVFGPRQDPTTQYAGAIAKFMTCALRGDAYPVFGDGEQSRDFTFVENVVHANLLAANAPIQGHALLNIAYGERATLNQIIAILNELTGQSLPAHYFPPRAGDVRHSLASIRRAHEILGYAPRVGLREGLEKTLKWYQHTLM